MLQDSRDEAHAEARRERRPVMGSSWQDLPSTGWDALDREHAELARVLAALRSSVADDDLERARASAEDLVRVAARHFAHEELLMRETGYARLLQHKEAHDLYLADAAAFARQVAEDGLTLEFRRWSTGRVLEWFRFHVAANDVALGAFLAERSRDLQPRKEGPRTPKPR
jgi:hemerythrin-like metal-binding protein